jgi:hypothetical protein
MCKTLGYVTTVGLLVKCDVHEIYSPIIFRCVGRFSIPYTAEIFMFESVHKLQKLILNVFSKIEFCWTLATGRCN